MNKYRITLLPGDGIGPEITDAAVPIIEKAVAAVGGVRLEFSRHDAGAERYKRTGTILPEEALADCLSADAVWLAAIGLPDARKPDGTEVQPEMMMGLRRAMELRSAARPAKLYPGVPSPLADTESGIDLVIVRENLEGLFASQGGGAAVGDEVVADTLVITRQGTQEVVDFAFQLAEQRSGRPSDGRRRVTCVDKANVFRSFAFFRKVFEETAASYPAIAADAAYVDAMAMYLVMRPQEFDVLVMENQFGDILSDLAASLVGGLGMGPSGEIGQQRALFQPAHGSAPDIAGRGVANPVAMILSGAMMLDWLAITRGDENLGQAASLIDTAVASAVLTPDNRTPDLGGSASSERLAEAVSRGL